MKSSFHAARDVDRPIFYSLRSSSQAISPSMPLTGPSGKLFHPMADTMAFALLGALVFTLTLCAGDRFAIGSRTGVTGKAPIVFLNWVRDRYAGRLDVVPGSPQDSRW